MLHMGICSIDYFASKVTDIFPTPLHPRAVIEKKILFKEDPSRVYMLLKAHISDNGTKILPYHITFSTRFVWSSSRTSSAYERSPVPLGRTN
jgi:hypothetical protein